MFGDAGIEFTVSEYVLLLDKWDESPEYVAVIL